MAAPRKTATRSTRAAATRTTRRTTRAVEPAPDPVDEAVDDAADDASGDPDDGARYIRVPLGGTAVRTLPAGEWRASDVRAANRGDLDRFFEGVIHPDDLIIYDEVDPTQRQVLAFMQEAGEADAVELGKSMRRSGSQRRTRGR